MSYYIYYINSDKRKMYLTSIGDENPLAGIGFQGGPDGSIPKAAGTTPTIESAENIIDYLKEACGRSEDYNYELVVE